MSKSNHDQQIHPLTDDELTFYAKYASLQVADKGKGSVEDGIEYIKSFDKVVIHERCFNTAREFAEYSYKVDERSGDITNKIEDKNNHCVDALRYALERSMKRSIINYNNMRSNSARF